MLGGFAAHGGTRKKHTMTVYRVELERLDHGYEARVPEIKTFGAQD